MPEVIARRAAIFYLIDSDNQCGITSAHIKALQSRAQDGASHAQTSAGIKPSFQPH